RLGNIVKAEDGDVVRNPEAAHTHRLHRAEGRDVIGSKNRRGWLRESQQLARPGIAARLKKVAFDDQLWIYGHSMLAEGGLITLQPIARAPKFHRARNKADAPMSQF